MALYFVGLLPFGTGPSHPWHARSPGKGLTGPFAILRLTPDAPAQREKGSLDLSLDPLRPTGRTNSLLHVRYTPKLTNKQYFGFEPVGLSRAVVGCGRFVIRRSVVRIRLRAPRYFVTPKRKAAF